MAWLHDKRCRIKTCIWMFNIIFRLHHIFHANKWILCDKGVSILHRLRYFEKVISPVACFGASHRAIHKDDLAKLDVEYRRLLRMVVGPPAGTNWASLWHEILHGWNSKLEVLSDYFRFRFRPSESETTVPQGTRGDTLFYMATNQSGLGKTVHTISQN